MIAHIYRGLSQWIATLTSSLVKKKGAINFEGIPGDHVFSVDILWKRAYFVEGSSGVEICNVNNEQEDCIIVKDTGVGSVKGMPISNSSK